MRYEIYPDNPNPRYIKLAIESLNDGGIAIYPTDTVYGIGCSIYQKKAIEQLYRLKGKSRVDSSSILCESIQQASRYARVDNFTFRILKRCFPGPFTIILEATREIPRLMLTRKKEIGIRIPDNEACRLLIQGCGAPLINASATPDPDTDPNGELAEYYISQADVVLDAGILPASGLSTIVRISGTNIEVLREGKGNLELLYS